MLKVSLRRKSEPVVIELEDGTEVTYSVREMTGAQMEEYTTKSSSKLDFDPKSGEVRQIKDYKGLYSLLLSYTLYDSSGNLVPEKVVAEWPSSVQSALHSAASAINGMGKDDDKEADPKKS